MTLESQATPPSVIAAAKALNGHATNGNGVDYSAPNGKSTALEASAPKIPGGTLVDILPEDANTKDDWVPRDPKMIRLTGRHPFNSEPPPSDLMASHITPPQLHYVRNHGPVPQVSSLFVTDFEAS